jgi:hypothetical protein
MLPAWKSTKLATVTEARSSQFSEHPNRLMREPGLSIWDVLAPTGAIYDASSSALTMRTIQQNQSTLASNVSLFGGIAPSQASRRQISLRSLGNYQLIMGRVHRMTSLDNLVTLPSETPIAEWQAQLEFVLRTFPPREQAPSLLRIVNACSAPSLWPRRQIALERLIQLQPDSDTASCARFKLLQMLCSDELQAWRQVATRDSTNSFAVGSLRTDPSSSGGRNVSALTPFDTVTASAVAPITDSIKARFDSEVVTGAALDAGTQVNMALFATASNSGSADASQPRTLVSQKSESFFTALDNCYKSDLFLANLPQLELMRDAMNRSRTGEPHGSSASNPSLESIVRLTALAGWPQAAQQELLLANDRPERLRWVAFAVATANRPRLDGVLDEPMWSACPPMKLMPSISLSAGEFNSPATVRWSFDDSYLYIAIDSPRDALPIPDPKPRLRKYDSDLRSSDYLHIMLDTDRDYASAVEFGISSEGETFDRCCELVHYNPQYAVAVPASPQQERWVAEVAIRLADLTTKPEMTGQAWAVSAHRRSPISDNYSWSSMLTEQPSLQSAGLLLFVRPPSK